MSDLATITIRIRYKAEGKPAAQRTVDVALAPSLTLEDVVERGQRRTRNALFDLLEDVHQFPPESR